MKTKAHESVDGRRSSFEMMAKMEGITADEKLEAWTR